MRVYLLSFFHDGDIHEQTLAVFHSVEGAQAFAQEDAEANDHLDKDYTEEVEGVPIPLAWVSDIEIRDRTYYVSFCAGGAYYITESELRP